MPKDIIGFASLLTPCQCMITYPRNIQHEWLSKRYCVFTLTSYNSGITYLAATHPEMERVQFIDFSYRKEDIDNVYHSLPWEETVLTNENHDSFLYKAAPSLTELNYFFKEYRVS